ncbi:CHAT domain-containing protein [Lactarius vividus]|nr:CHAT domain-containing protein [Lactarius vividus]
MLPEQLKSLDDPPSAPLLSHVSIGTTNKEERVKYDGLYPTDGSDVLGSIHEIDARITLYRRRLSESSRTDPFRPIFVLGMAIMRLKRYMLSNRSEDLDKSILRFNESILLPLTSLPDHGPLILRALFLLSLALVMRTTLFKQPRDAIYAAEYLRYLRDQPHVFGFPRHHVTILLVDALASQVELEAGNVMQNIDEMAILCRELLILDVSDADTTRFITLFSRAVLSKISPWVPGPILDQLIECLRAARKRKQDLREARFALAFSLGCRYSMTFVNGDYEDAMSILDEIITSSSPGDSQDEFVAIAQGIVIMLAGVTHATSEYSDRALYRARAFLGSYFLKKPSHFGVVSELKDAAKQRFRYFGSIEGLETSSGKSFGEYEDDVSEFGRKIELLRGLLSGIRNNDITEIDQAIEKGRSIFVSSATKDPPVSPLFGLFGEILFEAFQRTNKIEYLDESISAYRQVLERPSPQLLRSTTLRQLSLSLLTRTRSFPGHRTQDIDEGLELLSQYVNDGHASWPDRSHIACLWASLARDFRHPTVSTAYESALSLMQSSLLFAPTLQLQHATLATSDRSHSIPLDYASYQVDLGQLEGAIETLERGRALLWSEMRNLRAPIDQLLQAHPNLGHKFAAISRDLEEITQSVPPSHKLGMDDSTTDDLMVVEPFGHLLLKQRTLLKERDNLISQIQALPGFDNFLTSPSFNTLRSAASSGPVVIINHSTWRSDILILLHDRSPSLIPTPHDFYHRASSLNDKLLDSRYKYGPDSSHYDETLASVLVELYNLVGKPVINRLRQLQVPEQSRIWWCPTSVFCSLPLHAMGPIPSDDGKTHYFMDLYVCSYTPTLSALIQSRNRKLQSRSSNRPSLLLVAQSDSSLPAVSGEIQVVQALDTEVTSLISEAATPAAVIDAFHRHQFVHFVGSGTLEAGKPFETGFELYGGERLTLLDVVRSDLPAAEFAFLSACRTAEITEGSVADEVLHLAAAVQFCGFKSVVAAMWAMADEDGRVLAKHFYEALFSTSGRYQGIPYHERSANALQIAVKKLRRKRGITLERWVNFVHYGA